MTLHSVIPASKRHQVYNYVYADSTARLAAVGFVADDVGKLAFQESDSTMWLLADHSPITWAIVGFGLATPILADGTIPFAANESMGGNKLTNVGSGSDPGDAINYSQLNATNSALSTLTGRVTTAEGDIDDLEDYAGANVRCGFTNYAGDATVAFNETTRLFEITPTGATFDVWSNNILYHKGYGSITISNVTGYHWIYYNGAGTLVESVNPSDATSRSIISTLGLVSIIYYDAVNGHQIWRGEERHGAAMSGITHYHMHETIGTSIEDGSAPNGFSVDQDGSLNAHAQFGIAAGTLNDEDFQHELVQQVATANWHVLYKSGASGNWVKVNPAAAFPFATTGTGRAAWNELTGGSWQLTEVTDGSFVLAHVFATNDIDRQYFAVVGQTEYSNISDARFGAAGELTSLDVTGLPSKEAVWICTAIIQTSDSYTNSVKSRTRTVDGVNAYVDWRGDRLNGTIATPVEHGALAGLSDTDHPFMALVSPQYSDGITSLTTGRKWWDYFTSAGSLSGLDLTDNLDGTIDIDAGEAMVRTSDSDTAPMEIVAIPASAGITLTNNAINYVTVRWNAGSPNINVLAAPPLALTEVIIYIIVRHGTTIHTVDIRQTSLNTITKNTIKDFACYGFEHAQGGTIPQESGTRRLFVSQGVYYIGATRIPHNDFDTTGVDTFMTIYKDGAGDWTRTGGVQQFGNTQYDDGSGTLATAAPNKYIIYFLYICLNTPPELMVLYGQAQYDTLADAQNALVPSNANRPPELRDASTSALVGKIIILKNATNFADIQVQAEDQLVSGTGGVVAHAATHTNGIDDIQNATTGQKGLMTATQATTLSTAEQTANKNAASGYAGLDGSSKLTGSQQVYGSSANTACQGNDSRLSDARTPTSHASTHELGGSDVMDEYALVLPASLNGYSGIVETITIDTNPGIGKLVYKKSNGNYASADADAGTTMLATHLVLETGTGAGKKALRYGYFNDGAAATLLGGISDALFVSTTAGDYVALASQPSGTGDIVQCIGERVTANVIFFNPSTDWVEIT